MRRAPFVITAPLVLANLLALIALWPRHHETVGQLASPATAPALIAATVTGVDLVKCTAVVDQDLGTEGCVDYTVQLRGSAPLTSPA